MCYLHSEPSTFASFSRQVPSLWATRRRLVIGGCFSRRHSVWWPIRQFGKCFAWSADLAGGPLTGRVDKGRANCLDLHKMQSPKKLQFQFYLVVVIVGREEGGHFDQVGHGVELGSFADCVIQFVQSLVASRGGQFPLGRSSFLVACFPLGALPVTTQKINISVAATLNQQHFPLSQSRDRRTKHFIGQCIDDIRLKWRPIW